MVNRRDLIKRGAAGAGAVVVGGLPVVATAGASTSGVATLTRVPTRRALILLDRSSSMDSVRQATLDGLNAYLEEQRVNTDLHLSLLQFDEAKQKLLITETFVDRLAPNAPVLTMDDYQPRGGTPLYAAILHGIVELENQSGPDDKLLVVIQTDGHNTLFDSEINLESTKKLIASKEAQGNWTFVFLGADLAAWESGSNLGFGIGNTLQYQNNYTGTVGTYSAASVGTRSWYSDTTNLKTHRFFETPDKNDPNGNGA